MGETVFEMANSSTSVATSFLPACKKVKEMIDKGTYFSTKFRTSRCSFGLKSTLILDWHTRRQWCMVQSQLHIKCPCAMQAIGVVEVACPPCWRFEWIGFMKNVLS